MPSRKEIPVYAHRFGSAFGPESSRAALEKSLGHQVAGLECDIVLSGDDEVFALHDPDLGLSTNLESWATNHQAQEIDEAFILDGKGEVSEERPLRLRKVLELIPPDLPFQLDIKAYVDRELVERTTRRACEIVREHGTADRITVISFFTDGCTVAREHDITTFLTLWADYDPEGLVKWVVERGIDGVSCEGFILSKEVTDPIHDAGLTISVGAVNSHGQVERILPLEPSILVSDTPVEVRGFVSDLSARG